jgi:hypothetical protein
MGRVFGLIAAAFLLITLLVEMARLHVSALGATADAEKRLADLGRSLRHQVSGPSGQENSEAFVVRQNILHYRELLADRNLNNDQRRSIERLLAAEDAKLHPQGV